MPHPKWVFGSDHGLSADATGAPAILLEDSCPQAILKLRPPNSLDYSTRYGWQPANKSYQVCFRGDKNAFGVSPDPLGSRGNLGFAPRGQTETATNQKILLTKVVRYASGVTKWHLGSPLIHWGPPGVKLQLNQIKIFH